jgi:hypothetical protein
MDTPQVVTYEEYMQRASVEQLRADPTRSVREGDDAAGWPYTRNKQTNKTNERTKYILVRDGGTRHSCALAVFLTLYCPYSLSFSLPFLAFWFSLYFF